MDCASRAGVEVEVEVEVGGSLSFAVCEESASTWAIVPSPGEFRDLWQNQ